MKANFLKSIFMAGMLTATMGWNASSQNGSLLHFGLDLSPATESAQMIRYGNNVPSLYTGAMSYSIPVYTYTDPDFTIPISLDYHFDGFKPAQSSGTIGYGWHLNCGGIITREIFGLPDEQGYFNAAMNGVIEQWKHSPMMSDSVLSNNADAIGDNNISDLFFSVPLINNNGNHYDASADIFHFTLPGMHGDFMMLNNGNFQAFNISVPFGTVGVTTNGGNEYEITTGDGMRYTFGTEGAVDRSSTSSSPIRTAAYKLKRITASNGRTATFIYRNHYQINMSVGLEVSTATTTTSRTDWSYTNVLESIKIDGRTVVTFTYAEKQFPEYTWSELSWDANQNHLLVDREKNLSHIHVFNHDGATVQHAELSHTYMRESDGLHYRMFLSGVDLLSDGRYGFTYDVQDGVLPGCDCHAIDHWGFWNGSTDAMSVTNNYSPIDNNPYHIVNHRLDGIYETIIRDTRNPSHTHAKKGALDNIFYPCGGSTIVEYEDNNASYLFDRSGMGVGTDMYNSFGFKVGGVRVRKLTDVCEGSLYPVSFLYESNVMGEHSGILYEMPRYGVGVNCYKDGHPGSSIPIPVSSYGNQITPSVAQSCILGYSQVTRLYPDGSKEVTHFNISDDEYPAYLNEIWKNGNYCPDPLYEDVLYTLFVTASVDRSCLRGKVEKEEWYDSNGECYRSIEYEYRCYEMDTQMRLINMVNCLARQNFSIICPQLYCVTSVENGISTRVEYSYDILGRKSSETSSDPQKGASVLISYDYDPTFLSMPVLVTETRSRVGMTPMLISSKSYCYDYNTENRIPATVTETKSGVSRTTEIQCNSKYRPVRINYPGGRWTQYLWSADGRYLLGSTSNDTSNSTSYTWQDLVGLTSVTLPSGQSESYTYDSKGRLSERKDSDGTSTQTYQYHLNNE